MSATVLTLLVVLVTLTATQCFINRGEMRYTVQMDIFSGAKNPSWVVSKRNPMYRQIAWTLGRARPTGLASNLGYRGFQVEIRNTFGQRAMKTIGAGSNPRLEYALLNSASPRRMKSSVRRHVIDVLKERPMYPRNTNLHMRSRRSPGDNSNNSPPPMFRMRTPRCRLPRFDPENWNFPPVQTGNNCYNYATQIRTGTFAQPGRASRRQHRPPITARSVYSATLRDGFIPLPFADPRHCVIALVIWPGVDFHYYRLDADRTWSHKPGRTPAKKTDRSGNFIRDPRYADRGNYVIFAGFFGNPRGARVL